MEAQALVDPLYEMSHTDRYTIDQIEVPDPSTFPAESNEPWFSPYACPAISHDLFYPYGHHTSAPNSSHELSGEDFLDPNLLSPKASRAHLAQSQEEAAYVAAAHHFDLVDFNNPEDIFQFEKPVIDPMGASGSEFDAGPGTASHYFLHHSYPSSNYEYNCSSQNFLPPTENNMNGFSHCYQNRDQMYHQRQDY